MGQKTHPIGFRIGITKRHGAQWFARFSKRSYSNMIGEDILIRQNLTNLFASLLSPTLKNRKDESGKNPAQITGIQIQRGLIPYELSICIHAGNPDLLKASMDKLVLNPILEGQLKVRERYLTDLKMGLNPEAKTNESSGTGVSKDSAPFKGEWERNESDFLKLQNKRRSFKGAKKSSVLLLKKGKVLNVLRRWSENETVASKIKGKRRGFLKMASMVQDGEGQNFGSLTLLSPNSDRVSFVDTYLQKKNEEFLRFLGKELGALNRFLKEHKETQLQKYGQLRFAPPGYQKKWSLNKLSALKGQNLQSLRDLAKIYAKRSLKKFQSLRQKYLALGFLSKAETLNYYQSLVFLKNLKGCIQKIQKKGLIQLQKLAEKGEGQPFNLRTKGDGRYGIFLASVKEEIKGLKIKKIEEESRKVRFLYYLKDLIRQHRLKHLYYYRQTLNDSRLALDKLGKFSKQNADFLFGLNQESFGNNEDRLRTQKTLKGRLQKFYGKTLSLGVSGNFAEILRKQILKQKKIYESNLALTPKISLKFYKVKPLYVESKASIVAETIVNDLEKRKAFRRVILQAKEKLMANPFVKGVKIQVAGRLNGAEIARTEWIRAGRVPLQTLRANIDYSYKTANTLYGIIGVRVWVYKGYTPVTSPRPRFLLDSLSF